MAPIRLFNTVNEKLILDREGFYTLRCREDLKGEDVVVISVAGCSRQGRSFLLNHIMRYLKNKNQWADFKGKLEGFEWRGSIEAVTSGIVIWDEVFQVKTRSGKILKILLMDSEGVFDAGTSANHAISVLSFNLLVSTIQIYNLSQDIKNQDLSNLQMALRFTRTFDATDNEFRELIILIRDWHTTSKAPFGWEGGRKIFRNFTSTSEVTYGEDLELIKEEIDDSFTLLRCFLMPHPGLKAVLSANFKGGLSDTEKVFACNLRSFVSSLLASSEHMGGMPFERFCKMIEQYSAAGLNSESINPELFLDLTFRRHNASLCARSVELYVLAMEAFLSGSRNGNFVSWEEHGRLHHNAMQNALVQFNRSPKMGDASIRNDMEYFVRKAIQMKYKIFVDRNHRMQPEFNRQLNS